MIQVASRRLNSRFYAGPVAIAAKVLWGYEISPKIDGAMLDLWLEKMHEILSSLPESIGCVGALGARVTQAEFALHGDLRVFDDESLADIEPFIRAFTDAVRIGQDLSLEPFVLSVECKLEIKEVLLESEGATVPFAELDTEPVEKPQKTERVRLASPASLN